MITLVILGLVLLSIFGFKCMFLFSVSNGLFDLFSKIIDTGILHSGIPLQPLITNGRLPAIDWQIKATSAFFSHFTSDGNNPDTTLAGFSFLGAWGPAWVVIVLESFRKCNDGKFFTYTSVAGILIFNHSHAVMTPLYLALHLATTPAVAEISPEMLLVQNVHVIAIPWSFLLGYIIPVMLMCLPVSSLTRQSIGGWYQQWNLYILMFHYLLVAFLRQFQDESQTLPDARLRGLRIVYGVAFMMAAIPHWVVSIISCTAGLWPGLFDRRFARRLHPSNILMPTSPFTGKKVKDSAEGFRWLIQWDHIVGTAATMLWAATLYWDCQSLLPMQRGVRSVLAKVLVYAFVGGPMGVPIGLLWERDEILLSIATA